VAFNLLAPFLKNWLLKKIFRGHLDPQVEFSGKQESLAQLPIGYVISGIISSTKPDGCRLGLHSLEAVILSGCNFVSLTFYSQIVKERADEMYLDDLLLKRNSFSHASNTIERHLSVDLESVKKICS